MSLVIDFRMIKIETILKVINAIFNKNDNKKYQFQS